MAYGRVVRAAKDAFLSRMRESKFLTESYFFDLLK
jgi:hypothetical protein